MGAGGCSGGLKTMVRWEEVVSGAWGVRPGSMQHRSAGQVHPASLPGALLSGGAEWWPHLGTGAPAPFHPQEQQMVKTLPHLRNVNEDPQLSGVLRHFIPSGTPWGSPSLSVLLTATASCFFFFF